MSPLDVALLFRPLLRELIATLRRLTLQDWDRPTVAGRWRVRDVAAHLLDGDLRKLAVYRDHHVLPGSESIRSEQDLSAFINGLNADGVRYGARLSPRLLTELLEITGAWVATIIEALPPHAPSRFAVSWAGETESKNWMDTGREFTERWHHQAQIRDAVGQPQLLTSAWLIPLFDFSVRALPRAYAHLAAPAGTVVTLEIVGDTAATWSVTRDHVRWQVMRGAPPAPSALVRARADDLWRIFYNGLPVDVAHERLIVEGDRELAAPLLSARSVIL